MTSKTGQPSYYLVYGTRHLRGLQVVKDAMWKVDPAGGYEFSARAGNTLSLFTDAFGTLGELQRALRERFSGQTPTIATVEEFVLVDTDYRKKHVREALKAMEQRGEIAEVTGRKRRFTYPQGSRIRFA